MGTSYSGPFGTITKKMTASYLVALLYVSPCSLNLEVCSGLVTLGQSAIKPAEQECVPSLLPAELLS